MSGYPATTEDREVSATTEDREVSAATEDREISADDDRETSDNELPSSPTLSLQPSPDGLSEDEAKDQSIDVYLGEVLHDGSFGRIFKGSWMARQVAVMEIKPRGDATKFLGGLSFPEYKSLSHPNIVQIFCGPQQLSSVPPLDQQTAGATWLLQEWCDRGSLSQHCSIPRHDDDSVLEVVSIGADIASAGSYLHAQGIVHGNLNIDNVLLQTDKMSVKGYVCKVFDFRNSQTWTESCNEMSSACKLVGSVCNNTDMAPELLCQAQREDGSVQIAPAVDVYCFGIILWHALTGKKTLYGLSDAKYASKFNKGFGLAKNVMEVIHACTALKPQMRPAFRDLMQTLLTDFRVAAISSARTQRKEDRMHALLTKLSETSSLSESSLAPVTTA